MCNIFLLVFFFFVIVVVDLNRVSLEPDFFFFFVEERIMENGVNSGISESWSSVWRD